MNSRMSISKIFLFAVLAQATFADTAPKPSTEIDPKAEAANLAAELKKLRTAPGEVEPAAMTLLDKKAENLNPDQLAQVLVDFAKENPTFSLPKEAQQKLLDGAKAREAGRKSKAQAAADKALGGSGETGGAGQGPGGGGGAGGGQGQGEQQGQQGQGQGQGGGGEGGGEGKKGEAAQPLPQPSMAAVAAPPPLQAPPVVAEAAPKLLEGLGNFVSRAGAATSGAASSAAALMQSYAGFDTSKFFQSIGTSFAGLTRPTTGSSGLKVVKATAPPAQRYSPRSIPQSLAVTKNKAVRTDLVSRAVKAPTSSPSRSVARGISSESALELQRMREANATQSYQRQRERYLEKCRQAVWIF